MPVNKSARFRFEIIDECLRNTAKKWSKAELLKYVNRRLELQYGEGFIISISQLRYDLENMQSDCRAPIEMYKSGKNFYYRYEDANFSIKNIPVNEEDIAKLNTAVQVIKQIKGLSSIADDIAEIVKRLESKYNFNIDEQKNVIIFENSANLSNTENLEDIYLAIIRKNVLKITYQPELSKTTKNYQIHPYVLKEYCNVWYLAGHCQETQKIAVFELNRMLDVRISNIPYIEDLFLKIDGYFHDLIGVSKPSDEIQKVGLLFTASKAPHVLSYPIHASQKIVKQYTSGEAEITIDVIINEELIQLLLSYCDHVKVLSPGTLAFKISGIAKRLSNYYI
jgi:predicted DNA-binding transcriptional regulator YafY